MLQSLGPAPGIEAHAPHQIMIEETDVRWQVRIGDLMLADSRSALVLNETNYSATVYFPIADVQLSKLQAAEIQGYVAFYADRVTLSTNSQSN